MSPLFLIDAYGFVFRAYYSLSNMTTAAGEPIGALYGFCNMLLKVLREFEPQNIMIIFDSGQKNFRHTLNPTYKENRDEAPQDLISQFQLIRDFVTLLNLPQWEAIGFEADDLIATMATHAGQKNYPVTVISSDKDLMQLVDENLQMFDPLKDRKIGIEQVIEKFGVAPEKILDFLTLIGDKSDNIQGVNGIGPKTAAKLLDQFEDLDGILKNLHLISSKKIAQNLELSKAYIHNSRDLIRLADNVPLPNENWLDWSKPQNPDFEKLFEFLKKYGFSSVAHKIEYLFEVKKEDYQQKIEFREIKIETEANLQELTEELTKNLQIFIDFQENQLILAKKNYEIYIIDLQKLPQAITNLQPIFEDQAVTKIFLDAKKNLTILQKNNIDIQNSYEDLFTMFYCLSGGGFTINAENIKKRYFTQSDLPCVFHIFEILPKMLQDSYHQQTLEVYTIEKKITKILVEMEAVGVQIDPQILQDLAQSFASKNAGLEQEIFSIAGEKFNLGSPKQISEILFEKMGLPQSKKNKSGIFATDFDALQHLKIEGHEIAEKILQWRHYEKLQNTYLQGLQSSMQANQRIHTTYSNIATITGRLNSKEPNLQNLPIKSAEGREIRRAFVAPEGKILISADYSQIELRILAEIAQVKKLQQAFEQNQDIHTITAQEIFEIAEVSSEERRRAKAINFGIIYGLSAFGLSRQIGIPIEQAKTYIEKYFEKYPEIEDYMRASVQFAQKNGFVRTMLGRKCAAVNIRASNHSLQQGAQRSAINAPIQGTAADLIKIAMTKIARELNNQPCKMIMQIHDELIFESAVDFLEEAKQIISRNMSEIAQLPLKAQVNLKWGENLLF